MNRFPFLFVLLLQVLAPTLYSKEPIGVDRLLLCELEGEPSSMVAGCVNAITGTYGDTQVDLVVPGPLPLISQRSYCSSGVYSTRFLHSGWSNTHPKELKWIINQYYLYTVVESEPTGTTLTYLSKATVDLNGAVPTGTTAFDIHAWEFEDGLTNTARGEIGGRTNYGNQTVTYTQSKETMRVQLCNGGERVYQRISHGIGTPWSILFNLQSETEPNGNRTLHRLAIHKGDINDDLQGLNTKVPHFPYKDRGQLCERVLDYVIGSSECVATNASESQVFGRIQSKEYPGRYEITSDDGRKVTYHYTSCIGPNEQNRRRYLERVERPNAPPEIYSYLPTQNMRGLRLQRKGLPDNRFLEIRYYGPGTNWVGDVPVKVKKEGKPDVRQGMVCTLSAPVGHDQTPILTHRFFYSRNFIKGSFPEYSEGFTDVRDALNHRTVYRYVFGDRLTHIVRFSGSSDATYSPYSTERIYWGLLGSGQHANLICKALLEADETVRSCWFLEYDAKHNPIGEHILGNLSGTNTINPVLSSVGIPQPNGSECYTLRRTYSNDKYHLKESEVLPNGRKTLFRYRPESDLLETILTCDGDRILGREFREYDANTSVTKIIIDDGSGQTSDDLTGISHRRITYITPRKEAPCIGLPALVEECYLDLATGVEKRLGKQINSYSIEGWITERQQYDSNDELRYILRWEYDALGNVILEQNAIGQMIQRRFDANGNKIYEKGLSQDFHTEYTYDYSNRLVAEECLCADGRSFKQSYRYDYLGNRLASIDAFGNETTYKYDDLGRLSSTTLPPCVDANGNLTRLTISQKHDIAGNVVEVTDATGNVTKKRYNIRGQPTFVEHPDGSLEHFEYNLDGTLCKQIAQNGTATKFLYDVLGNVIRKEVYSSEGELLTITTAIFKGSLLVSETDPKGNVTSYQYDGAGRQVLVSRTDGWTGMEYDSLGRLHKTIQWIGPQLDDVRVTITEYDLLDRVVEERVEDAAEAISSRILIQYDHAGNRAGTVTFTQAGAATTQIFYDPLRKPRKVIDAEGNESLTHYDYGHINRLGQRVLQVTAVDAVGNRTVKTHDTLGRPVEIVQSDRMLREQARAQYDYDGRGKLIKRVDVVKKNDFPDREITTEWQYDSAGRVVGLFEAVGTPLSRSTLFSYNSYGEKVADLFADGMSIHYQYDSMGRLLKYNSSDGTVDYHFSYDLNSNIVSVLDEVHGTTTNRVYDSANRVSEETLANGLVMGYQYDGIGRLTGMTLPDQSAVHYGYDAGYLKMVARLDQSQNELYVHRYLTHDLSGNSTLAEMIKNCGQIALFHDKLGRFRLIQSKHFEEKVPDGGYDAVGNLLQKQRRDVMGESTCSYTFDPLHQLTSEEGVCSHRYAYDSLNNRVSKDDIDCDVNDLHQLLRQGDSTYRYDLRGHRIEQFQSEQAIQFSYDALGRLSRLQKGNQRWVYQYDSFNRRMKKSSYAATDGTWSQTGEERYLYQDQMEVGTANADGILQQFRVIGQGLGAEIGAAVAIELEGKLYAPLHDHSGHVVALLDADTGSVAEAYRYTAFGEVIANTLSTSNPWQFASKRYDAESGLTHFGRRYYDSHTGRWLTRDPKGFEDGPNLYAYVHNCALTHIDLYGLADSHCPYCGRPYDDSPRSNSDSWISRPEAQRVAKWMRDARAALGDGLAAVGHHLVPIAPFQRLWTASCRALGGRGFTLPENYQAPSGRYYYCPEGAENKKCVGVRNNGILVTLNESIESAAMESEENGGIMVIIVYNATHGLVGDLLECVAQIIGMRTNISAACKGAFREAIDHVGGPGNGGTVISYAHSQGGLTAYRGMQGLSDAELNMIDSVTVNSAKLIVNPKLRSATNIMHRSDLITLLADPLSYMRMRLGQGPAVTWAGSYFQNPYTAHGINDRMNQAMLRDVSLNIRRSRGE